MFNKIKTGLSVFWGIFSVITPIAVMMVMIPFGELLIKKYDMKIAPEFVVTDIFTSYSTRDYDVVIYKPVVTDYIWKRDKGFVQVDFNFNKSKGDVREEIDYTGDGKTDFIIYVDSQNNSLSIDIKSDRVLGVLKKEYLYTYNRLAENGTSDGLFIFDKRNTIRVLVKD